MGSELGYDRRWWDDVIWLGLTNIVAGNVRKLRLGADPKITSLALLTGVYVAMRLELELAGFEVTRFHYDWRQDIIGLGRKLKTAVAKEKAPVMIVAHSMGGLVARAAFKQGMRNVSRFLMIATPNKGSLAPVEAFRGTNGLARLIAGADFIHTGSELAEHVFSSFTGLHQMVLHSSVNSAGLDLMDPANWPKEGLQANRELLQAAAKLQDKLAFPDEVKETQWFVIAGTRKATKVAAKLESDRFSYLVNDQGDGTVPLDSATLAGVENTWFGTGDHPFITGNRAVREATVEILTTGDTDRLPKNRPTQQMASSWISERDLRAVASVRTRTGGPETEMNHRKRLGILFGTAEPLPLPAVAESAPPGRTHDFENVVISRKRQRRLEICLYQGSITDVNSRAYVVGTFPGVTPAGAAAAIDDLMDGAIREITGQRMFGAGTGEIFILPLARRMVRAETAVFVGLGAFDLFKSEPAPRRGGTGTQAYIHDRCVPQLEIAAENVAHTLARTYLEDFATVLLGGTISGDDPFATCESLLRGILRGLDLSDGNQRVRRVTICETNAGRYHAMRQHFVTLATSPLCDGLEMILSDMSPPPEVARLRALGVNEISPSVRMDEPTYLMVRSDSPPDAAEASLRFTVLGPSYRATIREPLPRKLSKTSFEKLLKPISDARVPSVTEIASMGKAITETLLPPEIGEDLKELRKSALVLLHDSGIAARVPWEALELDAKHRPALSAGFTRRFIASAADCRRWSSSNTPGRTVRMLLISNPTEDLDGAENEAKAIESRLAASSRFELDHTLSGAKATRSAIIGKLKKGDFDIVHYSGHASFQSDDPNHSGLLCARDEVLTGADLAGIPRLPFLMIVNACQSAKMRSKRGAKLPRPTSATVPSRSIAETMLCSGISNFIGTYWPVGDDTASTFAQEFYTRLLRNEPLGQCLLKARDAIKDSQDWPNYLLYGNPQATLDPSEATTSGSLLH